MLAKHSGNRFMTKKQEKGCVVPGNFAMFLKLALINSGLFTIDAKIVEWMGNLL
jgi:hypothetical protein